MQSTEKKRTHLLALVHRAITVVTVAPSIQDEGKPDFQDTDGALEMTLVVFQDVHIQRMRTSEADAPQNVFTDLAIGRRRSSCHEGEGSKTGAVS